jgi:hypothetical protein
MQRELAMMDSLQRGREHNRARRSEVEEMEQEPGSASWFQPAILVPGLPGGRSVHLEAGAVLPIHTIEGDVRRDDGLKSHSIVHE